MKPTESPDITQATPASMDLIDLSSRPDTDTETGENTRLSWGSRSDVGLVREHNEDSYLVRPPLFAVCDGMGGHAAGEVASSIAVRTLAERAPATADPALLAEAVEEANRQVIKGAEEGVGREGMGCTCTAAIIDGDRMAVAHVGDSRLYLLHKGTLVRVTHDHSFVEELVDAGEITADEARVHPSRSVITRALGSDPDMYADHFTLEVERGERVILCSDGLSSMIPDSQIEDIAVSTASPQVCADLLVSAALVAGGHDNVTVVVVDIDNDGREEHRRRMQKRGLLTWLLGLAGAVAVVLGIFLAVINNCWYLTSDAGRVAVYRGIDADLLGVGLSTLEEQSDVSLDDLPEAIQHQLNDGIPVANEEEAQQAIASYRMQIEETREKAETTASEVAAGAVDDGVVSLSRTPDEEGGAPAETALPEEDSDGIPDSLAVQDQPTQIDPGEGGDAR